MTGETPIEILSPLQSYSFMESWYELSDETHFWFQWRIAALMSQLQELKFPVAENLRALDVGCGTAVLRSQLEDRTGWVVDAADVDYNALRHAKPGRGRLLYYDITDRKPEMHEFYDVIVLFDVLEHIENTKPFIEALLYHLKPGGHLLVNVPALQPLYSVYDKVQGHCRRYNKESLASEFKDFPMEIKQVSYWGLANVPIILARKLWLALTPEQNPEQLFQQGFKPPGTILNQALLRLMKIEMGLLNHPWLGSSVLMTCRKAQ